jgi:hypothetical protein
VFGVWLREPAFSLPSQAGVSALLSIWADGTSCCARFRNDRSTPTDFDAYWFWIGPNRAPIQQPAPQFFSFGSLHDDVVQFALCDGSSRPIVKSIDKGLLRKLATRAEGTPIDSDF